MGTPTKQTTLKILYVEDYGLKGCLQNRQCIRQKFYPRKVKTGD